MLLKARALLLSCTVLMGALALPSHAASEAEVQLIYDGVRSKFPDFASYCKQAEEDRRKAVLQITMALVSSRKLSDPFATGPQAGIRLRQECGIAAPADLSKIRWTASAPPLSFDSGRGTLGLFTTAQSLANKVFAPPGDGPFPAVVLSHTVGGISPHLLTHAKALIEVGFAVLVVDTFGPRNYKMGINQPLPAESAKDAYDALAHLLTLPYIDKGRIFQTGYSYGALAAALLASPDGAQELKAKDRFRATVSNYGACTIASPHTGAQVKATHMDMLSADSDRPILLLMAEIDIETPPSNCFPRLEEMKAAGKDVHWHIYPRTTHGWDQPENNAYVFRNNSGETMAYRHDPLVSKDATARMIAFFNRYR